MGCGANAPFERLLAVMAGRKNALSLQRVEEQTVSFCRLEQVQREAGSGGFVRKL